MTNDDREGRISLNNKYIILFWKKKPIKRTPDNPEFAEMGHCDAILTLQ